MSRLTCKRYHDFSAGHRVYGHEGHCSNLHGHNYRVWFTCEAVTAQQDGVGRVVDFSVIKDRLCAWLEDRWDHRFLVWEQDPLSSQLEALDPTVMQVPFNPTAENMAKYLLEHVGPLVLADVFPLVRVVKVTVEETRKCSATCSR